MEKVNQTSVMEFILLGLTDDPNLQILLFILFLLIYAITLVGNIGIMSLIVVESRLHTPMYFLLSNLSLSDFCYSSVITPKMLLDFLSTKKSISFVGCAAQTYFFAVFASMECYLLSAMAYDRYAAICYPLLYHLIINRSICTQLVAAAYTGGFLTAAVHTGCTFHASFCGPNVIDHFYCDILPLMKLSCSETFTRQTVIFAVVFFLGFASLIITATSYIFILSAILQIPSTTGRRKAFSTCGSHLTAVSLFYGTVLFMYMRLPSSDSVTQDKIVSVCYTIIIPMLNPLIYSLRNKEVKGAILAIISRKRFQDY
ncbi:olfactory receptor 5AP2-like [Ambystoma mexicanum]|uniref:olfactory receptor 5AP2-like n=1 Tax=Ambystoma mexicanum TaxID=8296 RepID=UPI0037E9937C